MSEEQKAAGKSQAKTETPQEKPQPKESAGEGHAKRTKVTSMTLAEVEAAIAKTEKSMGACLSSRYGRTLLQQKERLVKYGQPAVYKKAA